MSCEKDSNNNSLKVTVMTRTKMETISMIYPLLSLRIPLLLLLRQLYQPPHVIPSVTTFKATTLSVEELSPMPRPT